MKQQITPKWTITTDRAESSYDQPVYVATECQHGKDAAHSLEEALQCGILQDIRNHRGLTQTEAIDQLGGDHWPTQHAWSQWENGHRTPTTGPYRDALENWILKGVEK